MKEINSKVERELTAMEVEGIKAAAAVLERYFRRPVYRASVQPVHDEKDEPYGVAFAFNMKQRNLP